jgi:hypothetical protein
MRVLHQPAFGVGWGSRLEGVKMQSAKNCFACVTERSNLGMRLSSVANELMNKKELPVFTEGIDQRPNLAVNARWACMLSGESVTSFATSPEKEKLLHVEGGYFDITHAQ